MKTQRDDGVSVVWIAGVVVLAGLFLFGRSSCGRHETGAVDQGGAIRPASWEPLPAVEVWT